MASTGIVRRVAPWVVLVGIAAVGWTLYSRRGSESAEKKYRTDMVSRGSIAETVSATGTISAVTTVQVGSQVSGIVSRLYADFNSRVRRGDLIAELDPTPFQAALDQRRADLTRAEVQMRAAEIDFRRQQRLLDEQLSSQADFDSARAAYDAARAQVDQSAAALRQAETNLRYTKIASPIDGVVVDRQYDIGQTVAASFQAPTLFTIAQDLTKMQVQADVDQADIGKIRVGQKARFTVDAYPDQDFEAEISQVRLNATVNQNVITYPVILTVPNPEEKLRPQMTANVTIYVSTADDVLRVPNAALRFRPIDTEPGGTIAASRASAANGARPGGSDSRPATGRREGPERALAKAVEGKGVAGMGALLEAAGAGAKPSRRPQTVYTLGAADELLPVSVRTGITDGRFTAISESDLKEGDVIVVGLSTSKVEGTGSFPGAGPPTGRRGRM